MPSFPNNILLDFVAFNDDHVLADKLRPSYYQLGFICGVQALPEDLDLEQWLAYLWKDGLAISFDNENQATHYAQNILTLVDFLQVTYAEAKPLQQLDEIMWIDDEQKITTEGGYFAAGFLAAIDIFNENWLFTNNDLQAQNLLQTTILLLTKLSSPAVIDEQTMLLFSELPSELEIINILPQLISHLANSAAQCVHDSDA